MNDVAPASFCAAFLNVLPIPHVAVSTLAAPFDVETVCASDEVAAGLDETQLDLGVGPCWQAQATGEPVVVPDLRRHSGEAWPMLRAAAAEHDITSVYALPMRVGWVGVGVATLYANTADALSPGQIAEATLLADQVGRRIMQAALDGVDDDISSNVSPRRFVHQATGMVVAQLRVMPEDALLIIRAHAFASGRPVREVAQAIISREINFSV